MERIATIVLLVASVAALGYLKMEQLDLRATNAEIAASMAVEAAEADAAELVEAAKIRFTIPHDRDVNTTYIPIALDGSESFDVEGDSLTYSWEYIKGNNTDFLLEGFTAGSKRTFRASPGEYTFKLTVSDTYGSSSFGETTVSVADEPNSPPEIVVNVYETIETIE